ncbi:serine hydrolase [Chiayiivirga flava]|uniref:Serine hydrolase n=1 Tax=Chiayiivirga flava TaxID=659595 RepID=A0A7W8D527_9GAMM|nr:serine hydrolase [Chiayiivirga flava]MBB5206836.1 hypothetical protein [Chiayiivirga flava]
MTVTATAFRACIATTLLLAACLVPPPALAGSAGAQPLFADGFEPGPIRPLFPRVDGEFQLPSNPTTDQLAWLMDELAAGETTTAEEVNAHFSAGWLSQIPVANTQAFLQSLRTTFPDAVIDDVVTVTSIRVVVVIRAPADDRLGYLQIGATYSGGGPIVLLGVSNYGGSTQYPEDSTLTLTQAVDKFMTLSAAPGLLIARIDDAGQCQPIVERDPATPRATGSIFKLWVMAGVARAIADGIAAPEDLVALVAEHLARGGVINDEPLGTQFSVFDLAVLMLGISDNTATDLLHDLVGRVALDQAVVDTGVADPSVLQPLLSINQQFHLFYSFPLAVAQDYVDGSEADQLQFLADEIEPLGPLGNGPFPYFNVSLLAGGSWSASPYDVCATFAHLRTFDGDAATTIDYAVGASSGQPGVRNRWDRVWYKGGSLAAAANDFHVLTHAWMLERTGEQPLVVVAMSNDGSGGVDQFDVQSVLGRVLELVAALP